MTLISITGTTGTGKSFLVKQLASETCSPAFFEGEEGTIPEKILKNVFEAKNPIKRWEFFINRYKQNLTKAKKISKNMTCFVDGCYLNPESILPYEEQKYHEKLKKLVAQVKKIQPNKILLLAANKKYIKESIRNRSSTSEQNEQAVKRALKIQKEIMKLAAKDKKIIILDRSNLDFKKEKDLKKVKKILKIK